MEITTIEFISTPNNLWKTIIAKTIAICALFYGFLFFGSPLFGLKFASLLGALVCSIAIWKTFRNVPWTWNNKVSIDLSKKQIQIEKIESNHENKVLDYKGQIYHFSNIDSYETEQFESFISTPIYLTKILVKGKPIKLLALENATTYTQLLTLMEKDINITLNKSAKFLS